MMLNQVSDPSEDKTWLNADTVVPWNFSYAKTFCWILSKNNSSFAGFQRVFRNDVSTCFNFAKY